MTILMLHIRESKKDDLQPDYYHTNYSINPIQPPISSLHLSRNHIIDKPDVIAINPFHVSQFQIDYTIE